MSVPASYFGVKGAADQRSGAKGGIPSHIYNAVADASARSGISFSYLMAKAGTESGFDSNAKAPSSSATGLYQFIESTWLDMIDRHGAAYGLKDMADAIIRRKDGSLSVPDRAMRQQILALRKDPALSAAMAAEYAAENKAHLSERLGRAVTDTDLYLAHFLGAGGAVRFLTALEKNGGSRAAALLPQAAEANPAVFYGKGGRAKSLQQIYASFERRFEGEATRYALMAPPSGVGSLQDASVSPGSVSARSYAARTRPVTQPGAVPGAATPFLTTYLLAALEAPLEAERATTGTSDRYQG